MSMNIPDLDTLLNLNGSRTKLAAMGVHMATTEYNERHMMQHRIELVVVESHDGKYEPFMKKTFISPHKVRAYEACLAWVDQLARDYAAWQ